MWNQAAVYRRRRRTFAASVLLAIVLIIVIATSTGGGGSKLPPEQTTGSTGTTALPQSSAPLTYTPVASLAEPVRASAAAPVPGRDAFSLLGGIDSAGNGTSGIGTITSNSTTVVGVLPVSLFAAAAVTIGDREYIFGGATGSAASPVPELGILSYDPLSSNSTLAEIAHLPSNNYGLAAAAIGSTVYIVGGDNGTAVLDTIVAWRPGGKATVTQPLPVALRYAAVAAVDGRIVIAGGLLANNTASRRIYVYDPATQVVTTLRAQLPVGLYAAAGASLGKLAYIIGGAKPTGPASDPSATPVDTIYSIEPRTGVVALAGTLTSGARAEAAAVRIGGVIYLAGGLTSGAVTSAAVGKLSVAGAGE
jgi:non-specific serine/threonine protein kinase